jgi:predicted ATPase/DNA-binding SARP family transcriptional activator
MTGADERGLRVRLFGSPDVSIGPTRVAWKAPPRTLPLLALLLLEPDRPANARKIFASQLWPDIDGSTAGKNFRRHLNYLKIALSDLGLSARDLGTLRIPDDIVSWVDVREFERPAVDRAAAERAVALYAGPLLAPYGEEEWIVQHRERCRRIYIETVTRIVNEDRAAGQTANALARAQASLEIEPGAEQLVRIVLHLASEIGDTAVGLAAYKRFVSRLADDFDEEPDRETVELAERLRRRTPFVSLPASADAFVGREDEIRELAELLQLRQCVEIYGLAGIGKSRLAAAVAAGAALRSIDGTFWIDVGRLNAGDSLEALVKQRLPANAGVGSDSLADRVAGKNFFLVFDECERAGDDVARIIETLAAASPGIRILVTSTLRLEIAGSIERVLEPLRRADAVALFIDRARAVAPRIAFDAVDRQKIASICSGLDGIPLAIELSARRTRTRTLDELLSEVQTAREPAVEGAIARTIDVLSAQSRAFFLELGSFHGDFDARTVAGVMALDESQAGRLLAELHDASLIGIASLEGIARFDMLDAVRRFARDATSAADRDAVAARHARFFCSYVVGLDSELRGAFAADTYRRIEPDYPEIAAALEYALRSDDMLELAARTCLALSRFWAERNYVADGIRNTTQAIDRIRGERDDALLLAELTWIRTWLRRNDGDYEASLRESLAALDGLLAAGAAPRTTALCQLLVANAARMLARFDVAMQHAEAALATFEHIGDRFSMGFGHLACGIVQLTAANVDRARDHLVEALRAYEQAGAKADAALAYLNLVECAIASAELELAETLGREAVTRCTEAGSIYYLSLANHGLAIALIRLRDWPGAIATLTTLARSTRELGDRELTLLCAEAVAELVAAAGRAASAAMLVGAADAERAAVGAPRPRVYMKAYGELLATIETRIGPDSTAHARAIGAAIDRRDLTQRIEGALREAARVLAAPGTLARS